MPETDVAEKSPVDELAPVELAFCYEYLANNFNASAAFRKCYPHTAPERAPQAVWKLMQKPTVKAALAKLCAEAIEPMKARLEYQILKLLNTLAFGNIFDYLTPGGLLRSDLDPEALERVGTIIQGFDQWGRPKLIDRFKAIELLAKYKKLIEGAEGGDRIGTINVFLSPKEESPEAWNRRRELEDLRKQAQDAQAVENAMEEDD